jgi:hypothetical protein
MFIAALFTVAKVWKQLRCPTINEWKTKITHTRQYYSTIKKNKNHIIFKKMDGTGDHHAE